jgi:hypothetical protein
MNKTCIFWAVTLLMLLHISCKQDELSVPPTIRLIAVEGNTLDGDTVEIGRPLKFRVEVTGLDANITNFTVKKHFNGQVHTVLDSGLNSAGFEEDFIFYQGVEEEVEWRFAVLDRARQEAGVTLTVYKDPNSQFGGVRTWSNVRMGYQNNTTYGQFFLPSTGAVYFGDSATLFQDMVDVLTYFYHSPDLGVMKPSPTFSSPGEEQSMVGYLYDEHFPFLKGWSTRNYTRWDIRAVNGITTEAFDQAQHDSLLIVSYDPAWGKKKYKWAMPGTFIPFQTAGGKLGIIKVEQADTVATGSIQFSMKIQI